MTVVLIAVAGPGAAAALSAAAPTAAPPAPAAAPAAVAPPASPVPPTAERSASPAAPAALGDQPPPAAAAPPPVEVPRVVLTADVAAAESDHDAVVGAWGVEVRSLATSLPVFSRRATTGCPLAPPPAMPGGTPPAAAVDCPPVAVSMLSLRHWVNRNLAWTAGAALVLGGGSQAGRLLDSYFGFGPSAGISVLLGNWRHLSVAASPALTLVWFKAAGSAATAYLLDLRADLEGELHLGFIGVPALSLSIRSGMLLRVENSAELTVWSAGVSGATTPRALVTDLTLRYYF